MKEKFGGWLRRNWGGVGVLVLVVIGTQWYQRYQIRQWQDEREATIMDFGNQTSPPSGNLQNHGIDPSPGLAPEEDIEGVSSPAERAADDAAHENADSMSQGAIPNPIEAPAHRIGRREDKIRNRLKGKYYSPGMKTTFNVEYGTLAINGSSPEEYSVKGGKLYKTDGENTVWCSLSSHDKVLTYENYEGKVLKYRFLFYRQ